MDLATNEGQISAQILHFWNPLGPNSGKRSLDARILDPNSWVELFDSVLRIRNGVGKQGYGNRPLLTIGTRYGNSQYRPPICLQNQWGNSASTDSPRQRIKEKSRYGNSVSTPHRRYGHRLRTPFCGPRFRDSYLFFRQERSPEQFTFNFRPALSGVWIGGNGELPESENILWRLKLAGKYLKFCRKSDLYPFSGSEI